MAMHSNWNPWHGCKKVSEGCENCYVYYLDAMSGKNAADVYKTKTGFKYPVSKYRGGGYKIRSGEMISVCMTSDFFLDTRIRNFRCHSVRFNCVHAFGAA